jgi:hypothetical protein
MKVYVLETITLTQDASGQPLSQPLDLLVLAASAPNKSVCRRCFTFGVHNDVSGGWHTEVVTVNSEVPNSGGDDGWQTRSLAVHIDKVTGLEHVFVSLGKPGILKGAYNPSKPTKITWESQVEYPGGSSVLDMRPMALTVANGSLYFSADDEIYKRRYGATPSYSIVHALGLDGTATNGGIRGMTTIPNPNGTGESLIYMWSGLDWPPNGDVMRLDIDEQANPPTYTQHTEVNVLDLMDQLVAPGGDITFTMGPHSEFRPVTDPGTGETVHVFGLLAALRAGSDPSLFWKNHNTLYGGAMYGIRSAAGQEYKINQVNGLYDNTDPSKPVLVAPRSFAVSPFGDKMLYAGGHDCAWVNTEADMAWIFRAGLRTALGR